MRGASFKGTRRGEPFQAARKIDQAFEKLGAERVQQQLGSSLGVFGFLF